MPLEASWDAFSGDLLIFPSADCLPPDEGAVIPGITGRFAGGVLARGLLRIFIRNARS